MLLSFGSKVLNLPDRIIGMEWMENQRGIWFGVNGVDGDGVGYTTFFSLHSLRGLQKPIQAGYVRFEHYRLFFLDGMVGLIDEDEDVPEFRGYRIPTQLRVLKCGCK